jgi:NAD(P)-dependent dehydrogenase (short-subunit alcohol dehydrogenase family)
MIQFDGQVAVVTGSGRGLGAAYATLLAERGAAVVVHDAGVAADGIGTDPTIAQTVVATIEAASGRAIACVEKLDSPTACQAVIDTACEHFGRLDILIHNAGLLVWSPITETALDTFERMLAVNVTAPFWLAQAAFPMMQQQQYGRIIFTTSGRALYADAALPELSSYALGKAAQIGLMHALAAEGAPHNILVNAISPAAATRMFRQSVGPDTFRPDQVAPGVIFLASAVCSSSGMILQASNGHFSTASWTRGAQVSYGTHAATPEMIATDWERITGSML